MNILNILASHSLFSFKSLTYTVHLLHLLQSLLFLLRTPSSNCNGVLISTKATNRKTRDLYQHR